MQVISNSKTEVNTIEAQFKIDAEEFETAVQAAYLRKRKNIQIRGFRKGKASRKMIETQFGESVFYEDAVNGIYQSVLADVIDELDLDVVDVPDIKVESLSKEEGVSFKAVLTVTPEVSIGDYRGIKVSVPSAEATGEDVSKKLHELQMKTARIVDVTDRDTRNGDTVVLDFAGYIDGELFEGGSADGFSLEIGSGRFIPGFEEQLIGRGLETEFDVKLTFPEDYNVRELAGKEAVFKCLIHEIKEPELSDLDDEFAKDVSEFDTIEELKDDLFKKISEEKAAERKVNVDNAVGEQLVERVEAEIPPIMIERRIDELVREWEYTNSKNGITLEAYLEYVNTTLEQFREVFRESATNRIKFQMALSKIAELENIEVTDEQVETELGKLAESHSMNLEAVKKRISPKVYKTDMLRDRAFELVKNSAVISDIV